MNKNQKKNGRKSRDAKKVDEPPTAQISVLGTSVQNLSLSESSGSAKRLMGDITNQSGGPATDSSHLSSRETRKLARKTYVDRPKNQPLFDAAGVTIATGKDECDCLQADCPGCHFPCPKCRSMKCGMECRGNRRWVYEALDEFETMSQSERGKVYVEFIPEKPTPEEMVID